MIILFKKLVCFYRNLLVTLNKTITIWIMTKIIKKWFFFLKTGNNTQTKKLLNRKVSSLINSLALYLKQTKKIIFKNFQELTGTKANLQKIFCI